MSVESGRCGCGIVAEGRFGVAYSEEAFRYFLGVERKRAELSKRSFLLVLIKVRAQSANGHTPRAIAARIFAGLWQAVREIDFIGWFREDRVIGAILLQGSDMPATDALCDIGRRITETLRDRMPPDTARGVHVRVLQLKPRKN
jgi:hypothetical protein